MELIEKCHKEYKRKIWNVIVKLDSYNLQLHGIIFC